MTTQTTTRRQLIRVGTSVAAYAAGAAIVTGGIAIAGEAKSQTPAVDRRAWDRAMVEYEAATATFAQADAAYEQCHAAWRANQPSPSIIDPSAFWPASIKQIVDIDPDQYERERFASDNWYPNAKEAADFRKSVETLREYNRRLDANNKRHGIEAACDRHDDTCNAMSDAEGRLMAMPAPDLAAVSWKLNRILRANAGGGTDSYDHAYVQPVLADVARLAGGEA